LIRVTLNGNVIAEDLPLAPTAGGDTWGEVSGTVSFPAGFNTLRITAMGGGMPKIDHLRAY
jgi:hypothetical protein